MALKTSENLNTRPAQILYFPLETEPVSIHDPTRPDPTFVINIT